MIPCYYQETWLSKVFRKGKWQPIGCVSVCSVTQGSAAKGSRHEQMDGGNSSTLKPVAGVLLRAASLLASLCRTRWDLKDPHPGGDAARTS